MNTIKDILKDNITQMQLIQNLSLQHIALVFGTAFICGILIYIVYKYLYRGAVYSESFGLLIVLSTLTVAFVIMTISSNIVLSMGMVGALSIVRFRAAVKDPLDVGFLFLAIAAGLTAGAGLFFIALIGTVLVSMGFLVMYYFGKGRITYLLVVRYENDAEKAVKEVLAKSRHKLRMAARRAENTEATYSLLGKADKNEAVLAELLEIKGVEHAILTCYSGEGQY